MVWYTQKNMRIFGILSNICREKHFIQLPFNGFVFWCASFPTQNEVFTICRQNISWNSSSTIVCNRFVCWFLCWDSNISHLNFLSINEIPTIWLAKIPVNSMTFLDYQDDGNVLSYFFLKAHADRHINIEISAKSHRKEWDGTLKKTPYQRFFFCIFLFLPNVLAEVIWLCVRCEMYMEPKPFSHDRFTSRAHWILISIVSIAFVVPISNVWD